jgi:uroporphyrinogen decarboxylase
MTPRQRVITALNREVPDRVPFELSYGSFTPSLMDTFVAQTGAEDPAEYWDYPVRSVMHRHAQAFRLWRTYARYYPEHLAAGATISSFGVVHLRGSTEHFTRHFCASNSPLRTRKTERTKRRRNLPSPFT